MKTQPKPTIMKQLLTEGGVRKIYRLLNNHMSSDVRKLCGRLLCEATYKCESNQDYLCELFEIEALHGRVSINQSIPMLIKKRLNENPDFLFSLHMRDGEDGERMSTVNDGKRFWSFPEFKQMTSNIN